MKKAWITLNTKLSQILLDLSVSRLENKCYLSIDELPIYNWFQIHATSDLSYIMIKQGKANIKALSVIWGWIYDEYINRFGMNDDFIAYLMKQREISLMKIDRWLTDNRSAETLIEVAELELKEMSSAGGADFFETKSAMEKELGFMIDVKKCSVTEFYSYVRLLNKPKKSQ